MIGFEGNSIVEAFATEMDGKWLSGLGMGAENLLIGGDYHPKGITYGDMEVMEINMGDGDDEFTITDTHVRADGYQTWTIINTLSQNFQRGVTWRDMGINATRLLKEKNASLPPSQRNGITNGS